MPNKEEKQRISKIMDFFKSDVKSYEQLKVVEYIYKQNKGNWSTIKTDLYGKEGFTQEIISNLEFTHCLAEWSYDNTDLISVFKKDDQIKSMRDIAAKFNRTVFIKTVKDFALAESEDEKKSFALMLHRRLFSMEPTAMLVNMIKDPQIPLLNNPIGGNVVEVLEKHPDYNIKTTSIYEVIKNKSALTDLPPEYHESVIKQLKNLQRIAAVSPDSEAMPVLYNANLHSSMQISSIPKKQFIAIMSNSGLDDNTIMQIHSNAQQTRVRNEQALMALTEAYKGTGIAMIDKSMNFAAGEKWETLNLNREEEGVNAPSFFKGTLEKHNLSWDLLFGDADFCECGECTSVYSAASYYVELLQYLRNNNLNYYHLDNPNTSKVNPSDISGTPLEKLFDRRPDLGCLELTCKNTNTLLPYIDLVNEVMENYVAFKRLKPFNVEDEESSELLAEPQHTEYQAYCILKNEVYPFTLPYHQPIDAARIYLKHLDTSRHELIQTFRKDNSSGDPELTLLKDEALDRAADAEYVGLTMEEYVILTKECFESKALVDKLKNKIHTDEEYRHMIGVKPVYQYYGYEEEETMLGENGLTLIKKEFLRRTGIDYFQLVDLLKTQYINRSMPKGKSKIIMESLHSSYRFLQNYAKAYGMDKMAEYLVKSERLTDLIPLLNKREPACPDTSKSPIEFSDKDIIHWVKCQFEKVGKIIVIESGRACVNGKMTKRKQANSEHWSLFVEDCVIFYYDDEKKREMGSIDKKTGEVVLKDPLPPNSWNDIVFTSDKGEKGVFMVKDQSVFLVFFEQKDSCDLDTAVLEHLDGTPLTVEEYDRIHRFIRLWRKLGWTMDETDQIIAGLSETVTLDYGPAEILCDLCGEEDCHHTECVDCDCEDPVTPEYQINPNLIHQIAAVKVLLEKTGLELTKLLTFWTDISTVGENSLYKRLFLTHNILGMDKIFQADENGNYLTSDAKLLDHVPAVMASLNLTADDILAIIKNAGLENKNKLTVNNLSILYRYRLLSKVLGLRTPSFISIFPLFDNMFYDAQKSLEFMNSWKKMESSGFTYQQLNYIIHNVDDEMKPLAPAKKTILQLGKTLYDGLNTIDEEHKDMKADSSTTDPEMQKLDILQKATNALIRTKTSLLFESVTVDQIIGILEGSNVFTNKAPKNLVFTLPDTSSLKKKLKYDKLLGSIQITGILTEAEIADYKNISNNIDWVKALTCIQNKQDKLFKELLSGVFENEQTKTKVEKEKLKAIIQSGDIHIPLDQIPAGEADPNTAPQKRAAFLEIFLPYLRQQLTYRFVIDALANYAELDRKITELLVTKVLKLGSPEEPIYSIFENIREGSKSNQTNWSGYLIPPSDTGYTFIIKNSNTMPIVSIDGVMMEFISHEDECGEGSTKEWWSATLQLQAGKLYKFSTEDLERKDIFWKTAVSSIGSIPTSVWIPEFASSQCEPALIALKKAAMLVSTFCLTVDEIGFLDHNTHFDNLDFNALTLLQWLRIDSFIRLRNSLPQTKLTLFEFWKWIYGAAPDDINLIKKIGELTNWKEESIQKLVAENHFNISKPEDYRNERNLLKLQKAIGVAGKIGIDIDLLFEWAVPVTKFSSCRKIADSIKHAIRAKYNQSDWEQVVKPLHDQLRNNQKDALIGYLLQQKELIAWKVHDADGLFEYFLIDVQMDSCMETSRMKQAISSVQLFVQRCFLGLEEEYSGIKPDDLVRQRWEWMQRYRVWEVNRKVFLYPENWIESNLRDDKSSFYKELESELLQKDINKQNVTDALKSYLYKVDEAANLEVVGLFIAGEQKDKKWMKDAKLHIFSRTRNAPYIFYYRYLELVEMNWYPWEKMQVDIPSYDVEPYIAHNEGGAPINKGGLDNGCFLTPVVWNDRLLIFFPQMMKKTKPDPNLEGQNFHSIAKSSIRDSKPGEYYEIKMAWSEYRNGKWTQKQISKDAIDSDPINVEHNFQYFKFVPIVEEEKVIICVDDHFDEDGRYKSSFEFNGNALKVVNKKYDIAEMPIHYFHQQMENVGKCEYLERIYSWQVHPKQCYWQYPNIYFYEDNSREVVRGIPDHYDFNHLYTKDFLGKINLGQLELFFKENLSMPPHDFGPFDPDNNSGTPNIYHELKRPYSLYNWELFFHTPILIADTLSKAQHFEEAMKWFHFVFNPIAEGNEVHRFWQFKPFKEINSKRILDNIFNNLKPNIADQTITEWRNKPFMPHVVARNRPVAYMKWVVMKYIDNLIEWGDYLFRQDTIESINQAIQIYVLAGHILGPRPMMIPKRGKIKPQTYLGLLHKWDAFSNAIVELELVAPFSNQSTLPFGVLNNELAFTNIFGTASSLYFCIPNNPKLMSYWDKIADRLFKIRHCQNIEGVFRKLPLFEPPIDPALLVKAAAQGLSIASVLNDLNTPMPNYRFPYLVQKALELCNELKSLGSSLLSAIEKQDNETIALIRAKHEKVMQNSIMDIKKKQVEEAQKNLDSLMQNRKSVEARMRYYLKLIGQNENVVPNEKVDFNELTNPIVTVDGESGLKLIPYEVKEMEKAEEASDWQVASGIMETIASIFNIIPSLGGYMTPIGVGVTVTWGGSNLGSAASAIARGLQTRSNYLNFQSSQFSRKANFTRAIQERIFQANAAGHELKQIDKQLIAQQIRIEIANQEITNQQKAIDNATEVEEFIKNKYSSEELYTWMRGSLKTLYHQVYNLAYDLAKKAEKTYCFERGITDAHFIQSGYFDAGRDGLLAGEQLYVGLKQLEAAYQNERGHDYEITKHLSLYQISPLAIIQLRETGKCEITIPEVLFDMDYPGHFKRRIQSVSVSIPCITGPYTGINATFSLLENKFRNTAIGGKTYEETTEEIDNRFTTFMIPIDAIAASSAQNDGGMFELNFKDERYLPFEGAGVISKWRLELPKFRQFDYHSISDVIIHLKYTACEGGERLKAAAFNSVSKRLESIEQELNESGLHVALNMKHDLPNEWHLLKKNGFVDLKVDKSRLPYIAQTFDSSIEHVIFVAKVKNNPANFTVKIDDSSISLDLKAEWNLCYGNYPKIELNKPFALAIDSAQLNDLEELILVVKYKF